MSCTVSDSIYLCKVKFYLKAEESMLLPEVKASMFRGVLGHTFKRFNCANRLSNDCKACVLKESCSYNIFFDSESSAKPFIMYSGQMQHSYKKGEIVEFELVLFGIAVKYLPQLILAFIEIGKSGLTPRNYKFTLHTVKDCYGDCIFSDGVITGLPRNIIINKFLSTDYNAIRKISMRFITPLRLTNFGDLVVNPTFEMLVKAITRRIKLIALEHCGFDPDIDHKMLIEKAKSVAVSNSTLVWKDWTRYSNRQHAKMEFGGLIGDISFEGDLSVFIPYLKAGELLHIGKNCVFGNGKYIITELL